MFDPEGVALISSKNGAFSMGASQIPAVKAYLARQKQHHQKKSFQEEFIELLEKYGIQYNEKYLWD